MGQTDEQIRSKLKSVSRRRLTIEWAKSLGFARRLSPLLKELESILKSEGLTRSYTLQWTELEADLQGSKWAARAGYSLESLVGSYDRQSPRSLGCRGPGWKEHPAPCYRRDSILKLRPDVETSKEPDFRVSLAEIKIEILKYIEKKFPQFLDDSGKPLFR